MTISREQPGVLSHILQHQERIALLARVRKTAETHSLLVTKSEASNNDCFFAVLHNDNYLEYVLTQVFMDDFPLEYVFW